ncbi:hypothetical protein EIN_129350 [Entamoeba invadens IP1]|uniref:Uncharacterized protein n=1 Tax=Entamoeba invadens IP1 TaxID=370355 RepID=L7FPM2_ENTIV|nr:hypothetical protein EIN_129350 [Entamoeba invadens IP1]ELP91595.1 hypothetical protein EIN_129350 [Entamoeba invadens IP1]|eukprot:XP_004258366.1 hypothetical protein EIN_129350 [Entamoeba invadens IP1]
MSGKGKTIQPKILSKNTDRKRKFTEKPKPLAKVIPKTTYTKSIHTTSVGTKRKSNGFSKTIGGYKVHIPPFLRKKSAEKHVEKLSEKHSEKHFETPKPIQPKIVIPMETIDISKETNKETIPMEVDLNVSKIDASGIGIKSELPIDLNQPTHLEVSNVESTIITRKSTITKITDIVQNQNLIEKEEEKSIKIPVFTNFNAQLPLAELSDEEKEKIRRKKRRSSLTPLDSVDLKKERLSSQLSAPPKVDLQKYRASFSARQKRESEIAK